MKAKKQPEFLMLKKYEAEQAFLIQKPMQQSWLDKLLGRS